MTKRGYMDFLEEVAVGYVEGAKASMKRNTHMNELDGKEKIKQRVIDAVIVDFINTVGLAHGLDEGYTAKDLYKIRNLGV